GQMKRKDFLGIDMRKPSRIDQIEWFASTASLCRAMNWIRQRSSTESLGIVRDLLSINPGLLWDKSDWKYVGYKGGSEPGVLNMTWLVQHKNGRWYALSVTWNNKDAAFNNKQMIRLIMPLIQRLGLDPEAK
ncbi:MAG: hypothetical protein AAGJ35_10535, partial [Myxococcota bacterium]